MQQHMRKGWVNKDHTIMIIVKHA